MEDGKKKKPYRNRGLTAKNVDLERVHKRALNALARDVDHLLQKTKDNILNKGESESLRGYLKFIKDLREKEAEKLQEISDQEIDKKLKD